MPPNARVAGLGGFPTFADTPANGDVAPIPVIRPAVDPVSKSPIHMETALYEYADERPGLMLYHPSRSQSLPKLRAFARFAQKRMRRDFRAGDYLPTVLP